MVKAELLVELEYAIAEVFALFLTPLLHLWVWQNFSSVFGRFRHSDRRACVRERERKRE